MIINGIKVKEVKQTGESYSCKGCIFHNAKILKQNLPVCKAPDNVICHFGMIFIKDE